MMRKDQVAAAFSAAAATYEQAARAQAISADHLAALVERLPRPAHPHVLEFGCGTGLLTRRLYPRLSGDWLVTDLSPSMLAAAALATPGPIFQVMDAESPPRRLGAFDLIVSNLAAQWFTDIAAAAARLRRLLAPGGHLVFSTLGAESFVQWRQAHQALGLSCGVPDFPTALDLARSMPAARVDEQRFTLDYADGRAFAAELKRIGAGTPAPGHRPLPVAAMRRLFQHLGTTLPMTYHVLHVRIAAE